jgi:Xaa-Pro aminopeptidase
MFDAATYISRRQRLAADLGSGIALFLGHGEAPMNYADNPYPFRQDSSFLYFWGLDRPNLAALLDADEGRAVVFGDEFTLDDIVWLGPQPTIAELAARAGVTETAPRAALAEALAEAAARGRRVHVLPQYRAETALLVEQLLGIRAEAVNRHASIPFIRAVVAQRSVKSSEEIAEIERALEVTGEMHLLAMRLARPGAYERELAGAMEGAAVSRGVRLAFPVICSIHGETLHNHAYGNRLERGHLVVNDSGAESPAHYAGDITRTIPVGGRFTGAQRDVYQAVLAAQRRALEAIRPGVPFRDVHLAASRSLAADLKALGCLRGDPEAAVAEGAHALFFPHGLGHMLGLDVHDMEGLGEDHVGYDGTIARSTQFGLRSLRLARAVQPGFVLTVEPGLYFIPALIDRWRAEGRFQAFIDYDAVDRFRSLGGIRIEDDVVVTEGGCRVLGPPIPKAIEEVEALAREGA